MKRTFLVGAIFFSLVLTAAVLSSGSEAPPAPASSILTSGFLAGEAGLNESERVGRKIWFFATAGNDRFHTYVFQQRLGVLIDWYKVLKSEGRDERFKKWGLVNDPDCCRPGSPDCPIKSMEETYGFDFCPGDESFY